MKPTEDLKSNNKSWDDVKMVTTDSPNKLYMSKEEFIQKSRYLTYDDGYGSPEIDETLKIVGDNWWLERHEYDGSEWWEYKEKPVVTDRTLKGFELWE